MICMNQNLDPRPPMMDEDPHYSMKENAYTIALGRVTATIITQGMGRETRIVQRC